MAASRSRPPPAKRGLEFGARQQVAVCAPAEFDVDLSRQRIGQLNLGRLGGLAQPDPVFVAQRTATEDGAQVVEQPVVEEQAAQRIVAGIAEAATSQTERARRNPGQLRYADIRRAATQVQHERVVGPWGDVPVHRQGGGEGLRYDVDPAIEAGQAGRLLQGCQLVAGVIGGGADHDIPEDQPGRSLGHRADVP